MTTKIAPAPASVADIGQGEVSQLRLHILRAAYLLLIVGGGIMFLPQLFGHGPLDRGVIPSMLGAMWLLSFFGLRYPLQLLPILLFELLWKTIWLIDYGLPQWSSGQRPPTFDEDFQAIAAAPLIFLLIIPWGYVYRHYVKQPSTRWR